MWTDDLPHPSHLSTEDLRQLLGLFQDTAIAAAGKRDTYLADWARVVADGYAAEINRGVGSRRELQRYVDEKRRDRPHGAPGDTTGLPSWREVSGPPDDERS